MSGNSCLYIKTSAVIRGIFKYFTPLGLMLAVTLVSASRTVEIDRDIWKGRTDKDFNPERVLRWHQQIQGWNNQTSLNGIALIGFASDEGVKRNQGRVGAAKGPDVIRKALAPLPWNRDQPAWDAGTVYCLDKNLEQAQANYSERLVSLLEKQVLPIGLGGGHEIAWGSYMGLVKYLEEHSRDKSLNIGIINFDAHFDLRDDSEGASSGTPFLQMARYSKQKGYPFHYFCLGISRSSNTQQLFDRAEELGVEYRLDQQMNLLNLEKLKQDISRYIGFVDVVYLTIDMDGFPASVVPGVSAPAARGMPLEVVEPLLEVIKDSGKLRVVDIAELNPQYDIDNRSAKVAARLIHLLTSH